MSLLDDAFAGAKAEGRALLVGYLPAGFPSYDDGVTAITAMVEAASTWWRSGCPTPTR